MKILVLIFVLLTGCNHSDNSATAKETTPKKPAAADIGTMPKKTPEALPILPNPSELKADNAAIHTLPADGSNAILVFKTLRFISDTGENPKGFFMRGKMVNGAFQPSGTMEGTDKIPLGGTPGWVELNTGQFFPAMTSRAPAQPSIEGRMTTVGFFPSQPILPKKE